MLLVDSFIAFFAVLTNPTVTESKSAMLADGYSLVSSQVSNGVTLDLWSQTSSPSKRSIGNLSTPENTTTINIQGAKCSSACAFQTNVPKVNTNDCTPAYTELYNTTGVFTLHPSERSFFHFSILSCVDECDAAQAISATINSCSIWVVNHSANNISKSFPHLLHMCVLTCIDLAYDYWDAGGTGQWLNWDCLIQQQATVGVCQYEGIGTNTTNGVWTAICAPTFMTG